MRKQLMAGRVTVDEIVLAAQKDVFDEQCWFSSLIIINIVDVKLTSAVWNIIIRQNMSSLKKTF